jgi:hypothetical protein
MTGGSLMYKDGQKVTYFEIIDEKGVIESPFNYYEDACTRLEELQQEGFTFTGNIKIVEVHWIGSLRRFNKMTTKKDACRQWVESFNAIPYSLIEKAYPYFEESGLKILSTEKECSYCGNTEFEENEDGEMVCSSCENFMSEYAVEKLGLPMWGTLWTFGESLDEEWARKNLEILRQCGFWVYDSDELGILIGIDGAGYDFYEAHWIPLYEARGLRWHDEE